MGKALCVLLISIAAIGCSSTSQVVQEPAGGFKNIQVAEFSRMLEEEDIVLIDVHIPEQQHISGTDLMVPFNEIDKHLDELPSDKGARVVIYCRSGNMSRAAAEEFVALGYTDVYNFEGGVNAWVAAGNPLE